MNNSGNRSRRRLGSRVGSAMVEFALGSTILMTAFTATFQYGYIYYQYNTLFNAVSNGANYASLLTYDASCSTYSSAWGTKVKNAVVYGDPSGNTTTPVVKNLTTSNVTITVSPSGGTCGSQSSTFYPVSMTVGITGYSINAVVGSFSLSGKPNVTFPFHGYYTP